jgi:hypothetical protein
MEMREALHIQMQPHLTEHSKVDYPDGWLDLVLHCNKEISRLYPEYVVVRIVEESGELHYEVDSVPNELAVSVQYAVRLYQSMSRQTCRRCGNFGSVHTIAGEDIALCTPHWQMAEREAITRRGIMNGK